MRFGILASAALTLGVAAFVPSTAKADDFRYDRHDHDRARVVIVHEDVRVEHRDVEFVQDINVCDAPHCVQDRVNDYRHGRPIERAKMIHRDGDTFFEFRIHDRHEGDFYLHIALSGHLISRIDVGR